MRKTFYDLLETFEFNAHEEYQRLLDLFLLEKHFYGLPYETLKEYIDREIFRTLPIRKSFTNLDDLMEKLDILKLDASVDDLFVFCEMLLGIMVIPEYPSKEYLKQCTTISENIHSILEKNNHEIKQISEFDERLIIVEKSKFATLAADIVTDKSVSFQIYEYNHYALKDNLVKKRQILVSISAYLEPILNSKVLSLSGYKQLESNVGFLLNKFHIRHNNKEGTKAQDYIISIDDETLEEWYDKTYSILLQAIITYENIKVEQEINHLKESYTWRN